MVHVKYVKAFQVQFREAGVFDVGLVLKQRLLIYPEPEGCRVYS